METKDLRLALIGLCGAYATSAVAIEPASITSGPIAVIPQLTVQVGHDDNIFTDETNEQDSLITVIKPSVQLVAEKENDAYRVTFELEDGTYQDSSADNYTDHSLVGEAIMELNSRNRLDLTASYIKDHEDRGSNDSGISASPDRYTDKSVAAVYRYGAEGAQGNLELKGSLLDHQFDNFKSKNESRDRQNALLDATFFYRVAPKTKALFEIRHEDIDYDLSTSDLDNTETKYLAGVTWDATAKTSGNAKIGYAEKDFDDASRTDRDGTSWEIGMTWAPQSYSTFGLNASQEFEETSGQGDAIDTESFSVTWNHSWSERVSTNAMLSRTDESYLGSTREDETDSLKLGVNYDLQRWLAVDLSYTFTDKESNQADESYERNQFMVTLTGSL
ncbi:outer membrane beta-barrel protein [Pontibacterium granulatum]|uniref:outer membrane beta-barrel protein n=1 Tax=Pontibacterium granulatum TaxID=2036029 RepID=UPI00249CCCC3|nr:outer membrane beta-barrel protein [Pontibacterium granulatum]MDI3325974.1 outer membrane beta-barrel protein [Pontibacterium granulatum]